MNILYQGQIIDQEVPTSTDCKFLLLNFFYRRMAEASQALVQSRWALKMIKHVEL
jgi:hypothetical protein